jgi:hypothetical protein
MFRIPVCFVLAVTVAGVVPALPERAAAASMRRNRCRPPSDPGAFPVRDRYAARGRWAVTTRTVRDQSGSEFVLVHPTDLGGRGVRHPIVTWGNGSFAVPSQYAGLLEHLASWGFVVVASTSSRTAKGVEMLAGARYLVAENDRPTSDLYRTLRTRRVGAVGHSQGAGGAVNATNRSRGLVKTTVPVALPDERLVSPGDEYDVARLHRPVLFLGGGLDLVIAPPTTIRGFYDRVDGPAAMAVLTGAGHNTIQGTGGDLTPYLTAWLRYQLVRDRVASRAFVGRRPEIDRDPAWQDQREKRLARRSCPSR